MISWASTPMLFLTVLLLMLGCSKKSEPQPTTVVTDGANRSAPTTDTPRKGWKVVVASGGPPARSGGYGHSYTLSEQNDAEFDAHVAKLLDETRVNDSVSLREYIELEHVGDVERLAEIRAKGTDERPVMFEQTLYGESGAVHHFWLHMERYSPGPMEEFKALLRKRGQRIESSPGRHPDARPDPSDFAEPPPPGQ